MPALAVVEALERRELPAAAVVLPPNPDIKHSQGEQSQLVVRVEFKDRPLIGFVNRDFEIGEITEEGILVSNRVVNHYYSRQSFGTLTFPDEQLTVVPEHLQLPYKVSDVDFRADGVDIITKATELLLTRSGYKLSDYLHVVIIHPYLEGKAFDYIGIGRIPGNRLLLNANIIPEVWAHELGHNAGVPHSGFFVPRDPGLTIADAGRMKYEDGGAGIELMDTTEFVGIETGGDLYALRKAQLGWLKNGTNVVNATGSATYRLYATDEETRGDDQIYAIRVQRNGVQEYWLEYRATTEDPDFDEGVLVTLYNYRGDRKLGLLDMTPDSQPNDGEDDFLEDAGDAPLAVGRTYSDLPAKVHITPLIRGVDDRGQYVDVVVTVGNVAGNQAPQATLTVDQTSVARDQPVQFSLTATDPNNDPLTYEWDFGDGSPRFIGDAIPPAYQWSEGGEYFVRVTINDGRGGIVDLVQKIQVDQAGYDVAIFHEPTRQITPIKLGGKMRDEARIASDGVARSVVVWVTRDRSQIRFQRLEGTKTVGSVTTVVNRQIAVGLGELSDPEVTMDRRGNFVVSWKERLPGDHRIAVQRFDAAGKPLGERRYVNTTGFSRIDTRPAQVRWNQDGSRFAVVWEIREAPTNRNDSSLRIQYRVFDATGEPVTETRTLAGLSSDRPAINATSDGGFALTWIEPLTSPHEQPPRRLVSQKLDSSGSVVEPLRVLSEAVTGPLGSIRGSHVAAAVAADGTLYFGANGFLGKLTPDDHLTTREYSSASTFELEFDSQGQLFVSTSHNATRISQLFDLDLQPLSSVHRTPTSDAGPWFLTAIQSPVGMLSVTTGDEDSERILVRGYSIDRNVTVNPEVVATRPNVAVKVPVLANDTNLGRGSLSVSLPSARYGTVKIDNSGTPADKSDDQIVYTPSAAFQGIESIVYEVSNTAGATRRGVLTVNVLPVGGTLGESPLVALPDQFKTKEDVVLKGARGGVLINDKTVNGKVTLSAELIDQPVHGTVTLAPDGSFEYRPRSNFSGHDTFTYRVRSNSSVSEPTIVAISVQPVSDVPVVTVPSKLTGQPRSPIDLPIQVNQSDVDGSESFVVQISGLPTTALLNHGTRRNDGLWTLTVEQLVGLKLTVPAATKFLVRVTVLAGEVALAARLSMVKTIPVQVA